MDDLRERAAAVAAKVFETMFFLCLEPRENAGPNGAGEGIPAGQYLKSAIQIEGEAAGQIKIYLPCALAQSMAENFLGLDEEVTQPQTLDMVGELLNMICGNLLSSGGKKVPCRLGMPLNEAIDERELKRELTQAGINLDFEVEGQGVRLQIQLA